jgi:hypothetical protein
VSQTDKLLPLGGSPGDLTQSLVSPNFHNPQGQTYTLGVQYQILNSAVVDVRYVGNHTSSQFQDVNANPFLGDVAAAFPNVVSPSSLCTVANSTLPDGADIGRLNCGSSVVNQITNTAFSQYNSIQANLTTRNYHGVTATFAFTHSKNIDNTSEIFGNAGLANSGGNTIAVVQNPLDIDRGERAVSGIDLPNTASISFTYSLPAFHTGKDLLNKLTNGWQANTIWVYNSGQPYTDYQGVNTSSPQANPDDNRTLQSYNDTQFNNNQVVSTSNAPSSPTRMPLLTARHLHRHRPARFHHHLHSASARGLRDRNSSHSVAGALHREQPARGQRPRKPLPWHRAEYSPWQYLQQR